MIARLQKTALAALWRNQKGSIATLSAVALPMLLLVTGAVIDYASVIRQKQKLQSAADSAAIAGAKRLSLADHKKDDAAALAKATAENYIAGNTELSSKKAFAVTSTVVSDPLEVRVEVKQVASSILSAKLGLGVKEVNVSASARVIGQPNICLLALERFDDETLKVDKEARVTGNNCAVFSNSASSQGISVKQASIVSANSVCSAGGFKLDGAINPEPLTDCPQFEDPLATQAAPAIGKCTFTDFIVTGEKRTINPGVYCGGLKIHENSEITFSPGLYIIQGGKFEIKNDAVAKGENVSFYLDVDSELKIDKKTSVEFSASITGPLAGLLFFGSRMQSTAMKHKILSQSAQKLLGTLYFPNALLEIGAYTEEGANVGGGAAYTAIVARQLKVKNKSSLTLNSNFELTDVPVPQGIRGVAQPVRLVD